MKVLLALDKFKGTASAARVCEHIATGLADASSMLDVTSVPIADGGDGTVEGLLAAGYERRTLVVCDARRQQKQISVAQRQDHFVIEVATICGLGASRPSASMAQTADSGGVGQALRWCLDEGARSIAVGLGGSATSDGGAGLLRELGVQLLDGSGAEISAGSAGVAELRRIDWSGLDARIHTIELVALCDVDAPLLGPEGAAAVFGPQKGADAEAVRGIEAALAGFASVVASAPPPATSSITPMQPGVGAAGGMGWALALIGARAVSGGEMFADLVGLKSLVDATDVVVIGEGRLDQQTFQGKAPSVVAQIARGYGVPVYAIVGQDRLGAQAAGLGISDVIALEQFAHDTARDSEKTGIALRRAGELLGRQLLAAEPTITPARVKESNGKDSNDA